MNPTRKRRMWMVTAVIAAASVAGVLITLALQQNVAYLHSPSEVVDGVAPTGAKFRLGGVVKEDSMRRREGSLEVAFVVTDRVHDYPVRYEGILPDLFREGQSVIARGSIDGDVFVAEEVLAKHDETYMPKEVADAMAEARAKRQAEAQAKPEG